MKLCFTTLGCYEKDLDEIISLTKKYGFDAIEIRGISGELDNANINDLSCVNRKSTREKMQQNGITPIAIDTSCWFHKPEKYDDAIAEGINAIEIAKDMGIRYVRVFGDKFTLGVEECTKRMISGLTYLCEQAADVNILLEIHGECNTIEALKPIIDKMSEYKNFGLLWDIQHSHRSYGKNWREFYDFIRPYIKHVHIKDYSDKREQLCLVGEGAIPIGDIVSTLLNDGYDGYFSLEWEKKWHPELCEMELALDHFVRVMNQIN